MTFTEIIACLKEGGQYIDHQNLPQGEMQSAAYNSTQVEPGALFIAIKGERVDGHDFLDAALEAGAVCALLECEEMPAGKPVIRVKNSIRALGVIANALRQSMDLLSVAVTGSVGKTTTKEMLAAVLMEKYNTHKNPGNKNNNLGLAVTGCGLKPHHQAVVFEMGMSSLGEISYLAKIAKPDIAIITRVGYAHIENLGSREGILAAKLEVIDGLKPGGTLVLNGNDEYLANAKTGVKTIYYGLDGDFYASGHITGQDENSTYFSVKLPGQTWELRLDQIGSHNVQNALAVVAVGHLLGMTMEQVQAGLLKFQNAEMRQLIEQVNGIKTIDDCYNANPDSMQASLNVLFDDVKVPGSRIAVLGDMFELGDYSMTGHYNIGKHCALGCDLLFLCGEQSKYILQGAVENGMDKSRVLWFEDKNALAEKLAQTAKPGDAVLFKGSRGMRMEEVLERFRELV